MRKCRRGRLIPLRALSPRAAVKGDPPSTPSLVLLLFLTSTLVGYAQKTYTSQLFQIILQYPPSWRHAQGRVEEYRGADGFFRLAALPDEGAAIEEVCEREAIRYPLSYSTLPQFERWQVQGQDACLIWRAEDQAEDKQGQATLIVRSLLPVRVRGKVSHYLILSADEHHLTEIVKTLRFTLPSASPYTGPDMRHPKRLILKLPGREEASGPAFDPTTQTLKYIEPQLCFTVEVPPGWTSGGGSGGFAQFGPEGESTRFNVSNVFLGRTPTLADALVELQRGGADIQDVRDVDVSGHSALWVTLRPVAQMRFVVLMIAPDCGYGTHSLFISALEANQEQFQTFLSRIRFLRSSKADR